jgi:drug/metabolite transporter (DMT)-like permease
VSASALALALSAAALHAGWNLLLARARDVQAATAVTIALSVAVFAPLAAATWRVDPAIWPYALGSAAFELVYFVLLAYAYATAELSLVYPVARGGAPVLALAFSLLVLSSDLSAVDAAGVLTVAAGVVFVRGLRRADGRALTLALAIAACIAGYTLCDSYATDRASPFAYLELVIGPPALLFLAWVWRRRGRDVLRAEVGIHTLFAALASFGAYALVLLALRLAPAASVAAVRETSVVIAVVLAGVVLREPVTRPRILGALAVVAGVALLASA